MRPERPYRPVLMIDSKDQELSIDPAYGEVAIALEIDSVQPIVAKAGIDRFITGNIPFLLVLNTMKISPDTGAVSPETGDLITSCLFSKNYIRQGECPVLVIIGGESPGAGHRNEYVRSLVSQLQQQGWPAIVLWNLSPIRTFGGPTAVQTSEPLLIQKIDFDKQILLSEFLSNPANAGIYIFFKAPLGLDGAVQLEHAFFTLCESALEGQPLSGYLFRYAQAKKEIRGLEREMNVLRERLDNADETIGIIRSKYKDDYDLLFAWYQKEYEVLPLWYKRVGHVVKVLTGKRSLKSLFSDEKK